MYTRVEEVLLGDGGNNPGIVAKFRHNLGAFTAPESAFMEIAPAAVVAMVRNLAIRDEGTAILFSREAIPVIALEMTTALTDEMFRTVRFAASVNQHHLGPAMQKKLDTVRQELAQERQALSDDRSRLADLLALYSNIRDAMQNRRYQNGASRSTTASDQIRAD